VPLAYLLGEREFHGLRLRVSPDVLVPRPETEILVDWALALLRGALGGLSTPEVADLGTGSGAIALAVKHAHAAARVFAVELNEAALGVARDNALAHRLEIDWLIGDWWRPLDGRRFHLVLANPPYVADGDKHLSDLRHEPAMALTPGGDGLGAIETIVRGAPAHLHGGGWLLLEHGSDQAGAARRCLENAGFEAVQTRLDLAGLPRCTGARWPQQGPIGAGENA
jgi:release factor glutamine methyltransferase